MDDPKQMSEIMMAASSCKAAVHTLMHQQVSALDDEQLSAVNTGLKIAQIRKEVAGAKFAAFCLSKNQIQFEDERWRMACIGAARFLLACCQHYKVAVDPLLEAYRDPEGVPALEGCILAGGLPTYGDSWALRLAYDMALTSVWCPESVGFTMLAGDRVHSPCWLFLPQPALAAFSQQQARTGCACLLCGSLAASEGLRAVMTAGFRALQQRTSVQASHQALIDSTTLLQQLGGDDDDVVGLTGLDNLMDPSTAFGQDSALSLMLGGGDDHAVPQSTPLAPVDTLQERHEIIRKFYDNRKASRGPCHRAWGEHFQDLFLSGSMAGGPSDRTKEAAVVVIHETGLLVMEALRTVAYAVRWLHQEDSRAGPVRANLQGEGAPALTSVPKSDRPRHLSVKRAISLRIEASSKKQKAMRQADLQTLETLAHVVNQDCSVYSQVTAQGVKTMTDATNRWAQARSHGVTQSLRAQELKCHRIELLQDCAIDEPCPPTDVCCEPCAAAPIDVPAAGLQPCKAGTGWADDEVAWMLATLDV